MLAISGVSFSKLCDALADLFADLFPCIGSSFWWSYWMQRRKFIVSSSAAIAGSILAVVGAEEKKIAVKSKVIGFTKSFSDLSLADTAALVEQVGWDGVDVTIRMGNTHIKPEAMAEELPKLMELLKARGKEVAMITSDITKISPTEEKFLRQLAACGVKKYRLGFLKYKPNDEPMKVVKNVTPMLRDIAQLNQELGLWGGYQNHSGHDFFGGPIWDVMMAMEGTDPKHLGLCFDIAHATVEGGQNWPIQARLAQSRIGVAYVKDYRWREEKVADDSTKWHRDAVPFGKGVVRKSYFDSLKKNAFSGEFCQHHEYALGSLEERVLHYQRDLAKLRSWID